MSDTGIFSLGDFTITTAATQIGNWVDNLQGVVSLAAQIRLAYGSGGTTIKVYLQTTLDEEETVVDLACFTFTTAGAVKVRNLSAMTPKLTDVIPTDGSLADDTSLDGVLGDRFRLKVISIGTYAGSTVVSGRMNVR